MQMSKHLDNLSNICTLLYSDLNELHAESLSFDYEMLRHALTDEEAKDEDEDLQLEFNRLIAEFKATSKAWDAAHIHECELRNHDARKAKWIRALGWMDSGSF